MKTPRAARVARVENALRAAGMDAEVVMLQKNTATAALAAAVLGCAEDEIAKSLMFRRADGGAVVAVISGGRRVSVEKLSAATGAEMHKADAKFVLATCGYEIGGVPPIGHAPEISVVMDAGTLQYKKMWAAAGSAHAVFPFSPKSFAAAAGAQIADIAE